MANKNLAAAKTAKNDEFYTQLSDIESELKHYRKHFKDKTVLCNCDDPFESNFFKYFVLNFNKLGLKKLIATCYSGSPIAKEYPIGAYKAVVTTVYDIGGDGAIDMSDIKALFDAGENNLTPLDGNGDFRNKECLDLLDEADIVVTNPPFSLFREFVAILMEHGKKFIIWGNNNAITYKEFFPLLKDNKVWLGYIANQTCVFRLSDDYSKWDDKITQQMNDGHKYGKCPAISVFTNLDIKKRYEELVLVKRYSPEVYPHYDNYDAINVNKVNEIPYNYDGVMGVPITFMDKYNPEQFEILGLSSYIGCDTLDFFHRVPDSIQKQLVGGNAWMPILHTDNGYRYSYRRLFIRRK